MKAKIHHRGLLGITTPPLPFQLAYPSSSSFPPISRLAFKISLVAIGCSLALSLGIKQARCEPVSALPQQENVHKNLKTDETVAGTTVTTQITMRQLSEDLTLLLPLLANKERFVSGESQDLVNRSLDSLRSHLESLNATTSRPDSQGGALSVAFSFNERSLLALVKEAQQKYQSDSREYAWWRLRFITGACVQCHATDNSPSPYRIVARLPDSASLSASQEADFYLATRQIGAAEAALDRAFTKELGPLASLGLLRRWLAAAIKGDATPKQVLSKLASWAEKINLVPTDKRLLQSWIRDLETWEKDPNFLATYGSAKGLIEDKAGQYSGAMASRAVQLLRATTVVTTKARSTTDPRERAEANLLLGLAYSRLPLFFSDELPEAYLKEAIMIHPHSPEAKQAYKALRSYLFRLYSGSGGSFLPDDIGAELKKLEALAGSSS